MAEGVPEGLVGHDERFPHPSRRADDDVLRRIFQHLDLVRKGLEIQNVRAELCGTCDQEPQSFPLFFPGRGVILFILGQELTDRAWTSRQRTDCRMSCLLVLNLR